MITKLYHNLHNSVDKVKSYDCIVARVEIQIMNSVRKLSSNTESYVISSWSGSVDSIVQSEAGIFKDILLNSKPYSRQTTFFCRRAIRSTFHDQKLSTFGARSFPLELQPVEVVVRRQPLTLQLREVVFEPLPNMMFVAGCGSVQSSSHKQRNQYWLVPTPFTTGSNYGYGYGGHDAKGAAEPRRDFSIQKAVCTSSVVRSAARCIANWNEKTKNEWKNKKVKRWRTYIHIYVVLRSSW